MRTTLDIDGDVLLAAKEIARQRDVTIGRVISDLTCQAMTRSSTVTTREGIPLFPVQADAGPITLELVNNLRDETP